jgi:hypothetical protein
VLWSALALLYWGSRLTGPPPGTKQVLDYVQGVVFAVIVAASFFVLRPESRDLRRGLRLSKQGDLDGAAASYQRAIDHGPRDVREPAARALIQLNNARAGE